MGQSGPRGPVVSPTGIVYPPGIAPEDTRYSQTAALYLRSDEPDRALDLALQGIRADSLNPVHYFLAGVAQSRLGRYQAADTLLARAERIYPAYELEVEPVRHAAWAEAFNLGTDAYTAGDTEQAIALWRGAADMYRLRPEAHRNLAMLLSQEGRLEEAAAVYRDLLEGLEDRPATRLLEPGEIEELRLEADEAEARLSEVLLVTERYVEAEPLLRRQLERTPGSPQARLDLAEALMGQPGKEEPARRLYDELVADPALTEAELLNLGVALFRAEDPGRAARAFARLTEAQPDSRDAWFNYANALLAGQAWETLVRVGDRILEVDPLNESAALIIARAHLETGDERGALERLHRIDAAPVVVEGLMLMRQSGAGTLLQGRVTGKAGEPGSAIRLRFTFYGENGQVQTRTVRLSAPPEGEEEPFEVRVTMRANAYRYELEQPER
jgi:tetratricopeptide (TPR) repeat protein